MSSTRVGLVARESEPAPERPLRADARRNRELVLSAGRDCFARCGLEAQMDDVARGAGVGVGTVYRHFPTKEALVEALAAERFRQLAQEAHTALDEPDAWEAFRGFLCRAAEIQASDRALSQAMAEIPGVMEEAARRRSDLHEAVAELIDRAQAAGELRADVTLDDVPMIMCGIGRAQTMSGGTPLDWRRYLAFLLDGLRAPGRLSA